MQETTAVCHVCFISCLNGWFVCGEAATSPKEAIIRHETIQQIKQNTEILGNKQSRIRSLNSHNNSTVVL